MAGCEVILAARRVEKLHEACECEDIQKQLAESSRRNAVHAVSADLNDLDGVEALAQQVQTSSFHPPPDILINAAGVNFREKDSIMSLESWDMTLELNLKVPFFFESSFVAAYEKTKMGKDIVNIASLQSVRAMPDSIPYGASKGGICQLTRAMAEAWSSDGICVNAIASG